MQLDLHIPEEAIADAVVAAVVKATRRLVGSPESIAVLRELLAESVFAALDQFTEDGYLVLQADGRNRWAALRPRAEEPVAREPLAKSVCAALDPPTEDGYRVPHAEEPVAA